MCPPLSNRVKCKAFIERKGKIKKLVAKGSIYSQVISSSLTSSQVINTVINMLGGYNFLSFMDRLTAFEYLNPGHWSWGGSLI